MSFISLLILVSTLLTAFCSLFLVIVCLWHGPKRKYVHFWVLVCLATTLFTTTVFLAYALPLNYEQALLLFKITFIAAIVVCLSLALFIFAFLDQLKNRVIGIFTINFSAWFFLVSFLFYPQWIIKGLVPRFDFPFFPYLAGWGGFFFLLWVLASLFYALIVLLSAFLRSRGLERAQLKYIFLGLGLGALGGVSFFFPLFGCLRWYCSFSVILLPLAPIIITYGIIRHRLMEIRLMMSHALGYFLVLGIFLAVYAFLIFSFENLFKIFFSQRFWFAPGFLIVAIAFLFDPFRRFIQKNLDRIFARGSYEYPKVVLGAVETLVAKLRIEDLVNSLVGLLCTALGVLRVGVLLPSADGSYFRLEYSQGIGAALINRFTLSANHPVLRWLSLGSRMFIREEQERLLSQEEFAILNQGLDVLSYAILVPLVLNNRLIGVVVLGDKASKKSFNQEDINLLTTISKQAAIALENARLYQEIRRSERAVGREKQRTDAVITSLTDGLIMLNPEGAVALVNPAAERMLGVHADLVLGKLPDPKMGTLYQVLIERADGGSFEIDISEPPRRIIRINTAPVRDFEGKSLGMIKVLHDITRERLVDQMKSEFISIASHRLRTPLSAIKWSLSMILQGDVGKVSDSQRDLLQKTSITNEHMIHLVNDLLNVARIEEGRVPYKYQQTQVIDLLKEVINENQYNLKTAKLKLDLILPKKLPPLLLVDSDKIKTVLTVILDNAIKYTPAKGKITITVGLDSEEVRLVFEDTGIGIPKEQQANIFTKFFRGDNVVRLQTEGTGLGLFLSKNIIERHQGRIWFESQEKRGSKFFITLPVKTPLTK